LCKSGAVEGREDVCVSSEVYCARLYTRGAVGKSRNPWTIRYK